MDQNTSIVIIWAIVGVTTLGVALIAAMFWGPKRD